MKKALIIMTKKMNKIEKLINELCPDGVEWLTLSEIGRRNKGFNITATKMKEIHPRKCSR